ncbi:MAG TPA: CHRD domain-containing protein [Candidatus Sulfomarinibacteraceae bacterium]|nr:CHRD domain-containing protein [Candidatus Sulfomarinibacteraceae bacterium]
MKRLVIIAAAAVLTLGVIGTVAADDDHNKSKDVKAVLSGFNEIPAISTAGTGKLRMSIDGSNTTVTYTLTFSGLEGGAVIGAHLHLGKPGVAGGVIVNLCPVTCVSPVTGTFGAANVAALPAQGIAGPADWAEVLKAIRAGAVYANVHTTAYPAGEIRGQLSGGWH